MKASKEATRVARQLLRLSFVDGQLDYERVKGFIKKIADEKPRGYLAILTTFQRLLRLEASKKHAVIESATELSESAGNEVLESLRKKYGDDLQADFKVNPDLVGGMRVLVGSDVWDGSVKARLQALSNKF